jgi:hypothetical protein
MVVQALAPEGGRYSLSLSSFLPWPLITDASPCSTGVLMITIYQVLRLQGAFAYFILAS